MFFSMKFAAHRYRYGIGRDDLFCSLETLPKTRSGGLLSLELDTLWYSNMAMDNSHFGNFPRSWMQAFAWTERLGYLTSDLHGRELSSPVNSWQNKRL